MADAQTNTGTSAPAQPAGFPPFKTETFAGQFVWLAITFAFLFVILWRLAGPRIGGTIAARKGKITGDLAQADSHRKDAEDAQATYETALAEAKRRAHVLAEENRKRIHDEIDRAKSVAEFDANRQMNEAEARIQATRQSALAQVAATAEEAAIAIVAHLTGETISPGEARAALGPVN
ncbi:MAG TPA: hypothetical protein VN154_10105 [Rhizomicrobium sp.]|nr:hypothetical protein [Rhizomicrobium sp.]